MPQIHALRMPPRRWWGWITGSALLLLTALLLSRAASPLPGSVGARSIDHADFAPLGRNLATRPVPDRWQPARLPHSWTSALQAPVQAGAYRLTFELPARPQQNWALRFPMVSEQVRIWLNGELLHAQGEAWSRSHAVRSQPLLVGVPPNLLRFGTNELLVQVDHGSWRRAGLAPVDVGPWGDVGERHDHDLAWRNQLPKTLNLLSMAVAAVLLLMWWRRRSEQALGLFGALYLVGSLRNYAYFGQLMVPPLFGDWALFSSVIGSACLLMLFTQKFVEDHWPRLERVCRHALWVLPLVAALATAVTPAALMWLRLVCYPITVLLTVCAYALMLRAAWVKRSLPTVALALSFTAVVLAAGHDAVFIFGRTGIIDTYWLPYAMPLVLAVFAFVLVDRLMKAVYEVEVLSIHLEQRVAERTQELAQANAAKSRFLTAASHDLRQPLHAIGLLVGLVREQIRYPAVRSLVDKIQRSVDGMSTLLKGLLDLSRLESSGMQPRLEDLALADLFEALRLAAAPQAAQQGLRLRFAETRAVVRSDRVLLHSILHNLLANALRYTPSGTVLVGARRCGGQLCIQVIDTGLGIAPLEQTRVFDEFYRGAAAARSGQPGFGLGLSIVQRAAQRLGHALTLRSQPGRGSCFEVLVPLSTAPPTPPLPRPDDGASATLLSGAFVLVLEHDAGAAEALQALLYHWGCHVLAAHTLEAAELGLQAHLRAPDVLLCELRLGTQDGLQVVQCLRASLGEDLPALLITGEGSPERARAVQAAGLPLLYKPVQPQALRAALAQLLAAAATAA
jgi:signal transduction histidine kinase/CheY-like chemotaxis protein